MYCTKDCNCSICRELQSYKPAKPPKKPAPRPPASTSILGRLNDNFILRRRGSNSIKTFQPQSLKCSEMCQQRDMGHIYDFCQRQTNTPSPTPMTQAPASPLLGDDNKLIKDKPQTPPKPNHKIVIYFGDSLAFRAKANLDDGVSPALQYKSVDQMYNEITATTNELPSYIESVQNGVINIKIEGNYRRASALVDKVSKPSQALVGKPKDTTTSNGEDNSDDDDGDEDRHVFNSNDDYATSGVVDWSFVQQWRAR